MEAVLAPGSEEGQLRETNAAILAHRDLSLAMVPLSLIGACFTLLRLIALNLEGWLYWTTVSSFRIRSFQVVGLLFFTLSINAHTNCSNDATQCHSDHDSHRHPTGTTWSAWRDYTKALIQLKACAAYIAAISVNTLVAVRRALHTLSTVQIVIFLAAIAWGWALASKAGRRARHTERQFIIIVAVDCNALAFAIELPVVRGVAAETYVEWIASKAGIWTEHTD